MRDIQKILFPVDFSSSSLAMSHLVDRTAALFTASVTLLHVFDPHALDLAENIEMAIRPLDDVLREHRTIQLERLRDFNHLPSLLHADRHLLEGDAATVIDTFAEANTMDLIVMPTHSGRFLQRLIGSTTARVINRSVQPVLTGRHSLIPLPRPLGHRKWICATDLRYRAEALVAKSAALAQAAGATLVVVHVSDARQGVGSGVLSSIRLDTELMKSARMRELYTRNRLDGQGVILDGPLRETLVTFVSDSEADLLIVGRGSASPTSGLMTDFTYAMVRDSTAPVLCL